MPSKTPTNRLTLDDAGLPRADGRPLKLPPKERAVLRLLLAHAPRAVRKDEFAQQAWAGGEMSDESLARCISRVRRVLLPHGLKVEAVYGLGYRLVDQAEQEPGQPGPSTRALDSYAHARQLMQQRTPAAMGLAVELLRALVQSGRGAEAVAEAQATAIDHPGQPVTAAFSLAIQAMVAPQPELEAAAWRLTQGLDTPPFVWTVASFVLSRLGRREATLDIVDTALLCSRTTAGEATLYAAPLAALGELDRAAALLRAAVDERCGMMAMVLRDPAHAHWLPQHPAGRALLREVFGGAG